MANFTGGESANSLFNAEAITEWFSNAPASTTAHVLEIAQIISVSIGGAILSIGEISLVSVSVGGGIYAIYKSRNKGKACYKFRVKENARPVHTWSKTRVGNQLVEGEATYYHLNPEFTVTNLSDFGWKIQKMGVAKLPWMKFIWVSIFECNKECKVKKPKIIRELLFDDGGHFQSDDGRHPTPIKRALCCRDWKLTVAQGDERTIHASHTLSTMFLYENTLTDATKKIGWLKAHIDSKRYYWVAMMNDHECLVGDRAECIGKEMRSRRKSEMHAKKSPAPPRNTSTIFGG